MPKKQRPNRKTGAGQAAADPDIKGELERSGAPVPPPEAGAEDDRPQSGRVRARRDRDRANVIDVP
jgi:hypothetical protein